MEFVTDNPALGIGWRFEPARCARFTMGSRLASEYAGLFAIRQRLEEVGYDGGVIVAHYRRFVSRRTFGRLSDNVPGVRTLTPREAEGVTFTDLLPDPAQDWLLTMPLRIGQQVGGQYNTKHILRDLLRFLTDAVDAGAIDSNDAHRALFTDLLIPACSVGCYPARWFNSIFRKLEIAAVAFLDGGYVEREGYQRRVLGFCLERLNNFLILQAMEADGVRTVPCFGYQMVVSNDGVVRSSI